MKPNSLISHTTPVSFCATLVLITAGFGFSTTQAQERFEFTSYKDVDQLFEQLNYTPEAWQAGIRKVPRVYLTTIHSRWRDRFSQEISVTHKKRLFFRALAPLVLQSNELIVQDRKRLEELRTTLASESHPTDDDLVWLHELALRYRVINEISDSITDTEMAELWRRVDIVPLSIALSQSAEESGWGTSRFAAVGNSLFGQWSWGKGITPQEQRTSEKGDYRIAAFERPLDSVKGYSMNLNTHHAYRELRARRAGLREAGKLVRGADLVDMLNRYSERGDAYVESLKTIMRVNQLDAADDAYLGDGPDIELIPVDSYSSSTTCLESERLKATQAPADSSC